MQVEYHLSAVSIAVHDQAITVLGDAFLVGQLGGHQKHLSNQFSVLRFDVVHGSDMGFGNDQDMCRRFGGDIPERQQVVRFVHDVGGNFPIDDLQEQVVRHCFLPWLLR